MQLEVKVFRSERKTVYSGGEGGNTNSAEGVRVVFGRARYPDLPKFFDKENDLDNYLLQFKRYATLANWLQANWATQLSALLSGKTLNVYICVLDMHFGFRRRMPKKHLKAKAIMQNRGTAKVLERLSQRIKWSAVCSMAPYSRFGKEARTHLCMDAWNRPTPNHRRLSLTQAV